MKFKIHLILPSIILIIIISVSLINGQETLNTTFSVSTDPNQVHFYHYPDSINTATNNEIIYNDITSLENSGLKRNLKTVFITHGFRSNVSSDMPQTVKNAFLASNLGYNVIVVSWGALSTPQPAQWTGVLYGFAALNIHVVSQRLADFILFLERQNQLKLSEVYLVGHSLGAHTSGLAGRKIYLQTGRKVARITGLDPAGPFFSGQQATDDTNLRKENAEFVDVIHTNMYTLGLWNQIGHADFYPNGGYSQPNCVGGPESDNGPFPGRCSHWYAYRIFAASLTKKYGACKCASPFMANYALGRCRRRCLFPVTLGYYCPVTARGEFYLTAPSPP